MFITDYLKDVISKRFADGSVFTFQALIDLPYTPTQIRSALVRLSDKDHKFLAVERKSVGLNKYRLSNVEEIEHDYQPGDTTVWHNASQSPVNHCGDGEVYEVLLHGTEEIECYAWRGFWPIPSVYIKGWRGVWSQGDMLLPANVKVRG